LKEHTKLPPDHLPINYRFLSAILCHIYAISWAEKRKVEAWAAFARLQHRLNTASGFVFFTQRIINVNVDGGRCVGLCRARQQPVNLVDSECIAHIMRLPRAGS